jgi:hypothetical protein
MFITLIGLSSFLFGCPLLIILELANKERISVVIYEMLITEPNAEENLIVFLVAMLCGLGNS